MASANAFTAHCRMSSTAWRSGSAYIHLWSSYKRTWTCGWKKYNQNRPHSGKYCFGKTPLQTFLDSRHLADEKMLDRLTVGDASEPPACELPRDRAPKR